MPPEEWATSLKCVVVIDQRAFARHCLASWILEFRNEFRCQVAADATELAIPAADIAVVLLGAGPSSEQEMWLERQITGLRRHRPDIPIMLMLEDSAFAMMDRLAHRFGLQGCIVASASREAAAATLRLVIAGGGLVSRARRGGYVLSSSLPATAPQQAAPKSALGRLTSTERRVFDLLAAGLPNKIIAVRLAMSVNTVKTHVHSILQKLGLRNRTEAAATSRAERISEIAAAPVVPVSAGFAAGSH